MINLRNWASQVFEWLLYLYLGKYVRHSNSKRSHSNSKRREHSHMKSPKKEKEGLVFLWHQKIKEYVRTRQRKDRRAGSERRNENAEMPLPDEYKRFRISAIW